MLDIYEKLKFENFNGGAWKQGKGWLSTFESYFAYRTKYILDLMLENLSKDENVKFIWVEMSYFSMWWSQLSETDKKRVKRIIATRQLEFVTGGWVMPDESSSHYYNILTQLIEGHKWLFHHLGYIPKNGWAIDPFGLSPTMAYILRRAGLKNMLIQRTHYAVKKHLAKIQELEFKWRQSWGMSCNKFEEQKIAFGLSSAQV